jgi:hypothetical protein
MPSRLFDPFSITQLWRIPMKRVAVLATLVTAFSLAFASPVLAAPPGNDLYAGRTIVGGLPFNEMLDTTEATTDPDDAEANSAECGAPATDASVWYELTAADDGFVIVDVSGSDYSAGVIVVTGSPGSFALVVCGPGAVAFPTTTGETYAILAFDDQQDGGGNGGTLAITIDTAPPPPTVDVTVDPIGQFTSSGSAVISGTVTCVGEADFTSIDLELRQRVGRFVISGFGSTPFVCDGTTQPWSVEVFAFNGTFKGGHAVAVTFAIACGVIDCGADFEEATVRLRR